MNSGAFEVAAIQGVSVGGVHPSEIGPREQQIRYSFTIRRWNGLLDVPSRIANLDADFSRDVDIARRVRCDPTRFDVRSFAVRLQSAKWRFPGQ